MKIYTKAGDKGMTGLFTGERVAKDSLRVEAYGTADETDAALGLARSLCESESVKNTIFWVQKILWQLMADLASVKGEKRLTEEHINEIERQIDLYQEKLPPLNHFIVAGDNKGAAALNHARTVSRRTERLVIALSKQEEISEILLIILNRLSDLCFVLARAESEL